MPIAIGKIMRTKLEQMFGKEKTDEWEDFINERAEDFNEFLLKTKGETLDELGKRRIPEEILFENKEQRSPDEIKGIYINEDTLVLPLVSHMPFHSEELLQKKLIQRYKNGKILEFGSGIGQELFNLEKNGFTNLHYYEVSNLCKAFVKFLITKYNLIEITVVEQLDTDYDGIMSWDVMEHIPNYKEVCEDLFKRLKPDGFFVVGYHYTPNGSEGRPSHYIEDYPIKDLLTDYGFIEIGSSMWGRKI